MRFFLRRFESPKPSKLANVIPIRPNHEVSFCPVCGKSFSWLVVLAPAAVSLTLVLAPVVDTAFGVVRVEVEADFDLEADCCLFE